MKPKGKTQVCMCEVANEFAEGGPNFGPRSLSEESWHSSFWYGPPSVRIRYDCMSFNFACGSSWEKS